MTYRLGIDTGGTYTDAVLLDSSQRIVTKFKSLTTRHDLTIGIGNALNGLEKDLLQDISLVSLSTTLTTNSVAEGRGAPVCVLLPGYNDHQVKKSGLREIIAKDAVIRLHGGHNALGEENGPLDVNRAHEIILRLNHQVSAYAISSLFAIRNSSHELKLRDMVTELTNKPVTCGHELASGLGAPQRALTAALNARMLPYIQRLIESVQQILSHLKIDAPLMIVKGDGSIVNIETALRQPVATVLSGPAASVIGACALSGFKNAIVADMGGTTTDVAIVTNGQPELCSEGARIGNWQPMVEAARVYSVGLGGDSEVNVCPTGGLQIGPRRVVPLCLLGDQFPWVNENLERQLETPPNARNNRFVMRLESNDVILQRLSRDELKAWESLATGPVELESVIARDRGQARALSTLQRLGLAIYSGFTPSDAAHVLGLSDHWSEDTAKLAARLWARQSRYLYGYGNWKKGDTQQPCQQVIDRLTEEIGRTLIEASLHQSDKLNEARLRNMSGFLTRLIYDGIPADGQNPLFKIDFAPDYPLVAVGAPARIYYPAVSAQLGFDLHLTQNGDVAGAVGAVMGSVTQQAQITISQPEYGEFYLFHKTKPQKFYNLQEAIAWAEKIVTEEAGELAANAGATSIDIVLSRNENQVSHDIDGELFLDCQIAATATGRIDYS